MKLSRGFDIGLGPVNGTVYLVVTVEQGPEMCVCLFEGVHDVDLVWELFGQFVRGMGHGGLLLLLRRKVGIGNAGLP